MGIGERNSLEVKARRGPGERARVSHWVAAGRVRCECANLS